MPGIAKLSVFALDGSDHGELAAFYSAITGWEIDYVDDDWAQLKSDGGVTLAFQLAPGHVPPIWPSDDHPQQAHLDFDVDDLDVGEEQVLALGARKRSSNRARASGCTSIPRVTRSASYSTAESN